MLCCVVLCCGVVLCACELMEIVSSLMHAVSLCNDAAQGYLPSSWHKSVITSVAVSQSGLCAQEKVRQLKCTCNLKRPGKNCSKGQNVHDLE